MPNAGASLSLTTVSEYEPVTVSMCGQTFATLPVTRERDAAMTAAMHAVLEAATTDDALAHYGVYLDARLKPTEPDGSRPSELLRAQWEADALDLGALGAFIDALRACDRG